LEFEKWKGAFSVDAEGTTESDTQDDGQGLLHNFVEYIKNQKCVPLEDLAAEFRMRTQVIKEPLYAIGTSVTTAANIINTLCTLSYKVMSELRNEDKSIIH
jgi:triosephosphate isomerase